jgi:hypothetical protein
VAKGARSQDPEAWKLIAVRFNSTMYRMANLFAHANNVPRPVGADMCRAAIVILHAATEELLRDVARLLADTCPVTAFRLITLPRTEVKSAKPPSADSLLHLAVHRGKTVDEVIGENLEMHLDTKSFSKFEQMTEWLRDFGVDIPTDAYASDIKGLLTRRHRIVHRADCKDGESEPQEWKHRDFGEVSRWINSVTRLGSTVLLKIAPADADVDVIARLKSPPDLRYTSPQ